MAAVGHGPCAYFMPHKQIAKLISVWGGDIAPMNGHCAWSLGLKCGSWCGHGALADAGWTLLSTAARLSVQGHSCAVKVFVESLSYLQ